jgi:predicted TIM-barrel fold metal-dependent hydrolase
MSTRLTTRNTAMDGVGLAWQRKLEGASARVPDGAVIVSADNHWGIAEDLWKDRVPSSLKDRVPTVWWDGERDLWNMSIGGQPILTGYVAKIMKSMEDRRGASLIEERMADLDADGIAKEVVFPQSLLMFFKNSDFEAREWIFEPYNDYLAEVGRRAPGRFYGVGTVNFWDPGKIEASVRRLKDLGLKTFVLPINPGVDVNGNAIHYGAEAMDVLWATVVEAGLPVYFHVGETLSFDAPGGVVATTLGTLAPFRKNFAELVFGGVFDRHPNLRIVFAEAGLNWVPGMLQDAEMLVDSFEPLVDPKLQMRPTDYWRRNCYATFMTDRIGLKLLDYVGADRALWSADYPHNEGTLGYTSTAIEEVVNAVSASDAKKILGGTAIELLDLA